MRVGSIFSEAGERKKNRYQWRRLTALLLLLLAGCAVVGPEDYVKPAPVLVPEQFFSGRLQANGIFDDRLGNTRDVFAMALEGHWDGTTLTLDELFTYDGGRSGRRLWTIVKRDDRTYVGTAADVEGEAIGELEGNAFHWRFTAPLRIGDPDTVARIDQWMLLQDSGVMMTRSAVSRFGIEIGEVTLFFFHPAQ